MRTQENLEDFKKLSKKYAEKLIPIKLFLLDADGILTNGLIFYQGEEVGFNRYFHVSDGYILKVLQKLGIHVGVISGGDHIALRKRLEDLGIKDFYLGNEDKRTAYLDIQKKLDLKDEEILYMGDELFDTPLMKRVGFSATVPHAPLEVVEIADYQTNKKAGEGAVREVADLLRYAKDLYPEIPDFDN